MAKNFSHNLPIKLPPDYFKQEHSLGEDERATHDIIKCCGEMEKRDAWNNDLASSVNGKLQTFLRQSLQDFAREPSWRALDGKLKETMSTMLPLAMRALEESVKIDLSEFDDFPQVGTSRLDFKQGLMAHVWQSAKSARNFSNGWNRIWQTIFDFRIEGIHAPYSAMFCIHGTYVSVTALPPVLLTSYPPIFLPTVDGCGDNLLSYMTKQLSCALMLGDNVALPLCYSRDGRFYVLSLKECFTSFPLPGYRGQYFRHELLQRHAVAKSSQSHAEFLKDVVIPEAVTYLAEQYLAERDEAGRKIAFLVSEKVLRDVCHDFGINLVLLYILLVTSERKREENASDAEKAKLYEHLSAWIRVEMVGRTLKQFARANLNIWLVEGKITEEEKLEPINRLAQFTAGKNLDFWNDHLLPGLRKKYRTPDEFLITNAQGQAPAALKILSSRLGAVFDKNVGRFNSLSAISSVENLYLPVVVPGSSNPRREVASLWDQVAAFEPYSLKHRVFTARALTKMAILHSDEFTRATDALEDVKKRAEAVEEESALEKHRLSSLVSEFVRTESLCADHLEALRTYLPRDGLVLQQNANMTAMQMMRTVMVRLTDGHSLMPFEEALSVFDRMKWALFTYNDIFDQSLAAIEERAHELDANQLKQLRELVRIVYDKYLSVDKEAFAVRYEHRVVRSLIDVEKAKKLPELLELAITSFDHLKEFHTMEHEMTMLSGYYVAHNAMHQFKSDEGKTRTIAVRKLIDVAHDAKADRQRGIAIAGPTHELLLKVVRMVDDVKDAESSERLWAFIHHFGEWFVSLLVAQRVGRGYLARLQVNTWFEVVRAKRIADGYDENPWKGRLTRFFKKYSPGRVVEVDGLLILHKGKEAKLLRDLEAEYAGREPEEDEVIVPPPLPDSNELKHDIKYKTPIDPAGFLDHHSMTADIDDILKDIFKVCDTDGDGKVTSEDCFKLLKSFAIMEADALRVLFVKKHGKRKIRFDEFKDMVLTGAVP